MKNKIFKYDFLIVGGGLIGALTALSLYKKNFIPIKVKNFFIFILKSNFKKMTNFSLKFLGYFFI